MKRNIIFLSMFLSANMLFSQIKINNIGLVGVGTLNPVEAFQIGDRFTFHNGRSKGIGYNFHYNGSPVRIKDDFASLIQFSSGGIYFSIADSEKENSVIKWRYPFMIQPINDSNKNGKINFLGYGIEISQEQGDGRPSIFPNSSTWGNCGTERNRWGDVWTNCLNGRLIFSNRLYYLQPQLTEFQKWQQIPGSKSTEILNKIVNLSCGYLTVNDDQKEKLSKNTDIQSQNQLVLKGSQISMVFPDLAKYDSNSLNYGIDLPGIIPYLIMSIQEQQKMIEELTESFNKLSINPTRGLLINSFTRPMGHSINELHQNSPNPFNKQTTIEFFLVPDVNNASILFYNLQGLQIKKTALLARGLSNIIIERSEFTPGIYYYSLVADGEVINIKSMIVID